MRVFVSEPSWKGTGIWSTHTYPRIITNFKIFLSFHDFNKVSEVSQCLFWIEKNHILNPESIRTKRKRFSIKSMLQSENQPLKSLSQSDYPCSCFRYSLANPLSTNEYKNGSWLGIKIVCNCPIPLFPQFYIFGIIIIMICDLVEPIKLLFQLLWRSFSEESIIFGIVFG